MRFQRAWHACGLAEFEPHVAGAGAARELSVLVVTDPLVMREPGDYLVRVTVKLSNSKTPRAAVGATAITPTKLPPLGR